jgi:hypothetical protein
MKQIVVFIIVLLTYSNLSAQKLEKVKFKDRLGNIIYYTAVPNSGIIYYCDLYYIPAGSKNSKKMYVVKQKCTNC